MINWHDYPDNNSIIPLFLNTVNQEGVADTISNAGIGIFIDNNQTFLTTGVSLITNFASRTGIHVISIASGTITGTNVNCTAFYTSGTVDAIDVTNRVVGIFSVGRYGQAPDDFSSLNISNGAVVATLSGDLTSTMKTSVNTEVLDVLNVDTFAQPGQGAPPATATPLQMFGYLYKAWRNKKIQTSSQYSLFNDDATTIDHTSSINGSSTGVTVGEIATGP